MSTWVSYPGLECKWNVETDPTTQYLYYTDGTTIWRKGVRSSAYVLDKALTPLGFDGIEGELNDWMNINSII